MIIDSICNFPFIEQQVHVCALDKNYSFSACCKQETDAPGLIGEHAMLHAQTGSNKKFLESDPTVDQEESEDNNDIPCFSDIETMVNINGWV